MESAKRRHVYFPTLSEPTLFCFPESVGRYSDFPEHHVIRQPGALNSFSIHVVVEGSGFVEEEGTERLLTAGDTFLYFPDDEQRYYSSKNDPWDVRWIHFYGTKLRELLIEGGFHRSTIWTLKRSAEWEQWHQTLLEEAEQHKLLHATRLSTMTYGLIAEFMSQAIPLTPNKGSEVTDRIAQLLPLIQQQAHLPFELSEWAAKAGVSVYYFCRLFRKLTQMTPMEFVTLCRLQRAKQLLLEKIDWPVKQISALSGYSNPSYFNKRFLEQEGMTPTEYRAARLEKMSEE
ncbi:helix-turn-helix domain-containing protein [Paenibacillus sp. MBLB4367]|uniref:helix-turn-helix domain-containing protein n=1 Tax=Paenibacillus sp. MBLB4367 TaxID=3384767 RepID=UPI00390829F0